MRGLIRENLVVNLRYCEGRAKTGRGEEKHLLVPTGHQAEEELNPLADTIIEQRRPSSRGEESR